MKSAPIVISAILCILFGVGSLPGGRSACANSELPWVPGIQQLVRLDRLAEFHDSTYVGSISSYDRTGGNDDGFGGKYSFVRKEGDAYHKSILQTIEHAPTGNEQVNDYAGTFRISLDVVKGPAVGRVQLFQDEAPVGPAVDMYAGQSEKARLSLGTLSLPEGENNLRFKIMGKNDKSSGMGLDLVNIVCERVD